uniref:Uncharacterized protein n=1 Tax=Tetranychus urticae TaxID=32264 RepID=T1KF44_TETUR
MDLKVNLLLNLHEFSSKQKAFPLLLDQMMNIQHSSVTMSSQRLNQKEG